MDKYYVYILANKTNSVLYIGVTNSLIRRVFEHKEKLVDGFTKKYQTNKLVYFEQTTSSVDAIAREKQLKRWRRDKKDLLIKSMNPNFEDLYDTIIQ